MRKTRLVPIAAAALLMAGCSEPRATFETPPPSEAETSAAEEPAEEEATEEQATEQTWDVAPSEEAPLVRGDEGPPAAEEGDAEAAAEAGTDAITAFFDTKDAEEWWPQFSTHLTPAAQDVWQYTDPGRVPSGKVEGTVELGPVSATDAEVTVPSSIGDFHLVLVRETGDDPWKVSAIEPPEEAQEG
ncbi:hypothetical protein [Brachybacterium tyrofermentans]|uniref:hypothetical protein n=2 Tax=Brachybacterium tyrofermentans TaxID=47848 RepID=UPI0018670C2E|nr:hypothetical protein [Brachybacterium tyrofermentans]